VIVWGHRYDLLEQGDPQVAMWDRVFWTKSDGGTVFPDRLVLLALLVKEAAKIIVDASFCRVESRRGSSALRPG
jgi:hypothetical protein